MRTALILIATMAVLVAACSSDDASQVASISDAAIIDSAADDAASDAEPSSASDEEAILAFSACMRDNGLDDFEDPEIGADGEIVFGFRQLAQAGEVDRETVRAAMDACREHLEGLSFGPGTIDRSEIEDELYEFAACMRDNGYDMPDPDVSGIGTPGEGGGQGDGPFGEIDPEDAEFQAALEACQDVFEGGVRLPGAGGGQGRGPQG